MIPKIIHYVWVGDSEKSELVMKCIDSWKKFCPDYKIIEWNNDTLKSINNLYLNQAFENKKWAFVSDYLRLYALKKFGGFYFDTDLELTNSINEFLDKNFVSGYEKYNNKVFPVTALMGSECNNKIICDLLAEYDNISFVVNGELNLTTNTSRISKYFSDKFGLSKPYNSDIATTLCEKCIIYPSFYFCLPEEGKQNYSIHHYAASWKDDYSRKLILTFKNIKIVRFHKRKSAKSENIPLLKDEKIIKLLSLKNYKIGILSYKK
ncbi:MAG: glycosyltransferase family 32 protein [Candidatus Gastranaerophilaceae bacterium]